MWTAGNWLLTGRGRGVLLIVLFFCIAFLVYYFTHSENVYGRDYTVAANAYLQGRLDIPNATDFRYFSWAFYEGKYYLVEPIMPALIILPGVAVYGIAFNQTMASLVIGGLNGAAVHRLMRGLTTRFSTQVWLTVLFVFGTNYWWAATDGSTTQFSHTCAVFFLFLAFYETLVAKRPFLAGVFLGAAHLSRLPTILSMPFFVIMFSDQWLPNSNETSLFKRVNLVPLVKLGVGAGIFVLLGMIYNYLAFDTPLPSAYNYYKPDDPNDLYAQTIRQGLFGARYIPTHLPGSFKAIPIFSSEAPYVMPSWAGLAFWSTTPAFLYAFFAGAKSKAAVKAVLALVVIAVAIILLSDGPSDDAPGGLPLPIDIDFRYGMEYYPFVVLILAGLFFGLRDKFTLACWAAVIPIGLMLSTYAFSGGWPQFGDRFALDYYPFVFLLVVRAVGNDIKWHHMLLITLAIIVNLWGILWIYKFQANSFLGLEWVTW